jgi:glycosyltransferase involved in cell wall biosynthesis
MNWLFIHQNFPGQYPHAARYLANAGHRVVAIGQKCSGLVEGVRRIEYATAPGASTAHEYAREFDLAVQNGLAVARECEKLKSESFVPDLIIGHNGWGETFYVKDVWPAVPLLSYFEFYYRPAGSDVDFDPEFMPGADAAMRLRTRNAVNLMGLELSDWGQTPTRWQLNQYPERYHKRISVIHEGIDTNAVRPDRTARLWLKGGISFGPDDQVITYSARNLEPYRGFHIFMRALPKVLRSLPDAHVLIVGGEGVSYGSSPLHAASWRQQLLNELEGALDLKRVHFLGKLGYRQYLAVLQLSAAHVYLTYPFVLSWSLLEALSAGCLVVASRTAPVEEVMSDGVNGYLVDFFDIEALAERIKEAVQHADRYRPIREAARDTVISRYDLRSICLPAHVSLWQKLTRKRVHAGLRGRTLRLSSCVASEGV